MNTVFIIAALFSMALCDRVGTLLDEVTTLPPPPKPYAFGYAAGRFPGHIDRTHSEVSDGTGKVQGSFSYVDPRHQIRTVEYVADKYGFHPILNQSPPPLPTDTPVVARAKFNHLAQYANIANTRQVQPGVVIVPLDTKAVENARNKHFTLFQKIAEEHAKIAAERAAEQKEEEDEYPNSVEH